MARQPSAAPPRGRCRANPLRPWVAASNESRDKVVTLSGRACGPERMERGDLGRLTNQERVSAKLNRDSPRSRGWSQDSACMCARICTHMDAWGDLILTAQHVLSWYACVGFGARSSGTAAAAPSDASPGSAGGCGEGGKESNQSAWGLHAVSHVQRSVWTTPRTARAWPRTHFVCAREPEPGGCKVRASVHSALPEESCSRLSGS